MTIENTKLIILIISLIVMLISMRRGIKRGISGEIRSLVSVVIAILCLTLILLLKRAVENHTYATVVVIGGALVILGIGWKLIKLILSPLRGFREIGIVKGFDSFLGAIAGILEGGAFFWVAMKIYELYLNR